MVGGFNQAACTSALELSNGSEVNDISFLQDEGGVFLYEVAAAGSYGDTFALEALHLFAVVHRPTSVVEIRRNGLLTGEANMALPTNVLREQNFLGRSLYLDCPVLPGVIGELLIYDRAVSDLELLEIESYLTEHWACCE